MKILYTEQALVSLTETLRFLIEGQEIPIEKVVEIKSLLLNKAENLVHNPYSGQLEEHLIHLNLGHRRIIENNIKIIYRVVDNIIYVADFFDARQNPIKMKG